MPNKVSLKKSSVPGKIPTVSDLDYGELAINYHDGVLFYKTASNTIGRLDSSVIDFFTITKTLTLTTDWQDTGIKGTDLLTGTYILQLFANDINNGGTNRNEYYSGTMSWYSGDTDSSLELPTDEIVLHRAGGSGNGALYLRTYRTPTANPDNLKLQIYSNTVSPSSSNYVFKFKKIL